MLWTEGPAGTLRLFASMGWPGVLVAACFATASTSFVVALAHTTVANILLMQSGVPLIAALMAFVFFREKVSRATALAIAAVISGVAIMVSDSLTGHVDPLGDGLALVISLAFATATVITRRHHGVRMMPAVCLGTGIAAAIAAFNTGSFAVGMADMGLLFAFGALNLGLGLALFASGARMTPAALTALIGTLEPILGPIWVWLVHGEVPSERTILGGAVVFAALFLHLLSEWWRQRRG
jgi:drug/metabolite transporter (DMT)-like permease